MSKLFYIKYILSVVLLVLLIFCNYFGCVSSLSDKRLCADPQCQSIISSGITKVTYNAVDKGMVSFRINTPVRIKSKSAGRDPKLWGIEVNGRQGFAKKDFIQEQVIYIAERDLKHLVDVEIGDKPKVDVIKPSETVDATQVDVDTVTKPLETLQKIATEKPAASEANVVATAANTASIAIEADNTKQNTAEEEKVVEIVSPVAAAANNILQENAAKLAENSKQVDDIGSSNNQTATPPANDTIEIIPNLNANEPKDEEGVEADSVITEHIDDKHAEPIKENISIENGSNEDVEPMDSGEEENIIDKPILVEQNSIKLPSESPSSVSTKNIPEQTETVTLRSEDVDVDVDSKGQLELHDDVKERPEMNNDVPLTPNNSSDAINASIADDVQHLTVNLSTDNLLDNKEIHTAPSNSNYLNDMPKEAVELNEGHNVESVVKDEAAATIVESVKTDDTVKLYTVQSQQPSSENVVVVDNDQVAPVAQNISNEANNVDVAPAATDEPSKISAAVNVESSDSKNHIISEQTQKTKEPLVVDPITLNEMPQDVKIDMTLPALNTDAHNDGTVSANKEHVVQHVENIPAPSNKDVGTQPNLSESVTIDSTTVKTPGQPVKETDNIDVIKPLPLPLDTTTVADVEDVDIPTLHMTTETVPSQAAHKPSVDINTPEVQVVNPDRQYRTNDDLANEYEKVLSETDEDEGADYEEEEDDGNDMHDDALSTQIPTVNEQLPNEHNKNDVHDDVASTEQPPINQNRHNENLPHEQNKDAASTQTPVFNENRHNEQFPYEHKENVIPAEAASTERPAAHNEQFPYEHNRETHSSDSPLPTQERQIQHNLETPEASTVEVTTAASKPAMENVEHSTHHEAHFHKEQGLFSTIYGTVKNLITNDKKHGEASHENELDRILFSGEPRKLEDQHCYASQPVEAFSLDNFMQKLAANILKWSDLVLCLGVTSATLLCFVFGYYCFCNSNREGGLLSKLNLLERSMLAAQKENAILKSDLAATRKKLSSIEDNSFGSNDMVISLRTELDSEKLEKAKLQEQVGNLEKELESAAEAGLELNRIVSELLSNQTGDDSIISSVEELQKQLNEQQNTIMEINANLADKSRENSELQLLLAEQQAHLSSRISALEQDNDELEQEKSMLQTKLQEMKTEFDEDITRALEGKNSEIKRLQAEICDNKVKYDEGYNKLQTSQAKVEALEECLKKVKKGNNNNKVEELIDVAYVRAELLDMQKKYAALKETFDIESETKTRTANQLTTLTEEFERIKADYHQSEKDKLEAQTRLEVLSSYFKEKEAQLQKELSLKETMWFKQQGEATSTVERLTEMQEEIQSLKSQNDSLRAEIEAQIAAHKAQIGTLENRAHETWLAARQSDRRYEEARAEAAGLRRKLTALAGFPNDATVVDKNMNAELQTVPSPVPAMEPPGSPLLGRLPPPPPFLPPHFMAPPPAFIGMPPPFLAPGEMRPAPLGRIMSPPPPLHHPHRSGRYSDPEDFDPYDDDDLDDADDDLRRQRRPNSHWNRSTYSPPRTYRSHSPESHYDFHDERDFLSNTYDTEPDLSPPVSPKRSGNWRPNDSYDERLPSTKATYNDKHDKRKPHNNSTKKH